jgi:Flp pilus assembly protein CpaB
MKKKLILKVMLCVMCFLLIICVLLLSVNLKVKDKVNLTNTYIAIHDIDPRSCIKEKDIQLIQIPKEYLNEYVINEKDRIIGMYTDIQGKIPAGSLFYESMLYSADELPDLPSTLLKENQAVFTAEIDSAILANLVSSQRVDLIASIKDTDITDIIIEHCRILQIEDHDGIDVESEESIGIPYCVLLAVDKEDIVLLEKIKGIGTYTLSVCDDTYQELEGIKKENSEIVEYLNSH